MVAPLGIGEDMYPRKIRHSLHELSAILRTTPYKQAFGSLHMTKDTHCALGVISIAKGIAPRYSEDLFRFQELDALTNALQPFPSADTHVCDFASLILYMNDNHHKTFTEIADVLDIMSANGCVCTKVYTREI